MAEHGVKPLFLDDVEPLRIVGRVYLVVVVVGNHVVIDDLLVTCPGKRLEHHADEPGAVLPRCAVDVNRAVVLHKLYQAGRQLLAVPFG